MCGLGCGNDGILWIILLLILSGNSCGCGNNSSNGCGMDNSCLLILLLLFCCGGNNQLTNCTSC